ncbi:MAG: ribonuclease PH [Deltaproteobacteria bacterium]|nr:ribonuclease PH [Deltaproteobacteria bacterium]
MTLPRNDGRPANALRTIRFEPGFNRYAEGSVLTRFGDTVVLCNASLEETVPPFLRGQGRGWVTAEYAMIPRAGSSRSPREAVRGRIGGRTHEIQRLIGRSLRAVTDLSLLGERTLVIDCDVLQADGGTRTAAITGSCLALSLALRKLEKNGVAAGRALKERVAAVSVGLVAGAALLDLNYEEDSRAAVDMNFVVTESGRFVEIQGTGEEATFSVPEFDRLRDLALEGCRELLRLQAEVLG